MLTMVSASVFVFIFAFTGYPLVYCGCRQGKQDASPPREWKMMESDAVAHGVVISTEPDPSSAKGTYSVLFEVRCSYKGGPLPELIRINKVGYNPDNCVNSSLTEGPKYLVFLAEMGDGQYVQQFRQESGESQYVDEIVVICEASVEYPIGKNMTTAKEECPGKYMYEDCIRPDLTTTNPPYDNGDNQKDAHDSEKVRPDVTTTNPPYDSGDNQKDAHDSEEVVDQKTQVKPDEGKDIPKEYPSGVVDGDNGSSVTVTLNMSAMILLLLAVILQL